MAFAEREICPAPLQPSLRATGSRECAPDDRLIQDLDCFVANAPRVKSSDLVGMVKPGDDDGWHQNQKAGSRPAVLLKLSLIAPGARAERGSTRA